MKESLTQIIRDCKRENKRILLNLDFFGILWYNEKINSFLARAVGL